MNTYSQSKVKAWRRCHKQYRYKYDQKLVRRQAPATLARGVTFHEMLDYTVLGKDWREPLEKYTKEYNKLWLDETEGYSSPQELESLYLRYMAKYANDNLDYRGKSEIEIQVEHEGLIFKGIIDKLPKDPHGRVWLLDHKTNRMFPDEDARFSDIQTVLYYWALKERGEPVDGVCWDYIRTKPPSVPEVLKSGGLSKRANIDTDEATYMKAITDNNLDPAPYQEILEKVRKNVFFKRVFLPNPSKTLIQSVVNDFFSTAKEIEQSTSEVRSLSRDCKQCSYYPICSEEVRGIDSSFTRKSLYRIKEES